MNRAASITSDLPLTVAAPPFHKDEEDDLANLSSEFVFFVLSRVRRVLSFYIRTQTWREIQAMGL